MSRKLYRLKHKPTGLYLKNGGILTERGHVYTSGINTLNCDKNDTISIEVRGSCKFVDKYKAIMEELYPRKPYTDHWGRTITPSEYTIPKTDFEKEIVAEV